MNNRVSITNTQTTSLELEAVTVEFGGHAVLDDVTFSASSGNLLGVVGPNGAGKSTLFNVIAGLQRVVKGSVQTRFFSDAAGGLAYVPQRDQINWRFPVTVEDVVAMGRLRKRSWFRRIGTVDKEVISAALERVGLTHRRSTLVTELSGGQRQRTFVAKALAQEAEILLLDEAFTGVDVGAQETLVEVLKSLRDDGKIVLMATHDLTNLAERFDQVLCLNHHICAFGDPSVAFTPEVLEELYGAHGLDFGHSEAEF